MQLYSQRQTLQRYAAATWQSFVALTYPNGLPADQIQADGMRTNQTSPTNIGAYMWSVLVARDLGLITADEAHQRLNRTLQTLAGLERHAASGQFYNWYAADSGAKLTSWPPTGTPLAPFLSSVDNGWLAAALMMVANSMPALHDQANAILAPMDFGFYYDPAAGLLRGGYWPTPPVGNHTDGYTRHHYGALNTETRIASYIGIARGQIPATHYFKLERSRALAAQAHQPYAQRQSYLGVDVFQGYASYMGLNLVPSWGGSMFEALMVPLFVPEESWGPQSWGINHPLYVQAQILHGTVEARYGYWGFSPSNNPSGGYREYGVAPIGMMVHGYACNNDNRLGPLGPAPSPSEHECKPQSTAYANGIVTPHAAFLALDFAPEASLANLEKLCQNFDVYGPWGFWDAVNVTTGEVSRAVLALDQGMILLALGNALCDNRPQRAFADGLVAEALQPLLALETFTVSSTNGMRPDAFPVEWPVTVAREAELVVVRP